MKLKYRRVPYDQLPLELEANWFLGEPDMQQYRKNEYFRSQTSIFRKQKSIFTSMISVRSGGESEDIGDKIGLSVSGNSKVTMGKKLPDQHIINYETIRNLVHSRFDTAKAAPRQSIINSQLFGQVTVSRLRKLQIEELDKIDKEEKQLKLKRTFSRATDLGEELKDQVEEHLTPITTEDKGILAGLLQPGMGGLRFGGRKVDQNLSVHNSSEEQKQAEPRMRRQSEDIQQLFFNLATEGEEQPSMKLPQLGTHQSDRLFTKKQVEKSPIKEVGGGELHNAKKQSRSVSPVQRRMSRRTSKRFEGGSANTSINKSIFMKSMHAGKSERKMLRVLEEMQFREQKKRQEEENRKKEEASIQKSKLEIDLEQEMEKDSERERKRKIREEAKAFQDQKLREDLKNLRNRQDTPDRRLSTILDPKLGRRSEEKIRDMAENEIEMGLEHQNRLIKRAKNETILMRKGTTGSSKSNYSTAGDEMMRMKQKELSTLVRRPSFLSPVFTEGGSGSVTRQRSELPSDVKNYRRNYKLLTEFEKDQHEEELNRQEEIYENEKEWKQIDQEELLEELGRVKREPKRGAEWSGDQVLHDFASMAHNHPLLPQPLPLQVYLFNKYEKKRQSTYSTGGSGILGTQTFGTQERLLGNEGVHFTPTTLVCPYIEEEPIPAILMQRNSGMAMLSRQSSIRISTTSRFAPLITNRLERVSKHLPGTYAMTLAQQATEGLYGVTQDDRIEMRQHFMNLALSRLNHIKIWKKGCWASIVKFRYALKKSVKSLLFQNFMTLCVAINTIGLAAQHYGQSQETSHILEVMNLFFTAIFILEMTLKLIGLGIKRYLADPLNYLDGAVVIISIMELTLFPSSYDAGAVSAFKTFRIFRTFRVLRVARLLRSLKQMQMIVSVISRSVGSFMYLAMLLLLFLFIYTLLGMQLFGGKFNFEEGTPRGNFDHFHSAFVTVFQLLTLENWQLVLFSGMRSFGGWSVIYFLSWIFIGNFVLLNLFLAILLDSFLDEEDSFGDSNNSSDGIDPLSDKSVSLESRSRSSQSPNDGFFIAQPTTLSPPLSPMSRPLGSPDRPLRTSTSKYQTQTTTPYKSSNQNQPVGGAALQRLHLRRNSMIKRPGDPGDRLAVSTFALQRQNHIAGASSQTEPLDKRKSKSAAIAGFIKKRGKRMSTRSLKKSTATTEADSFDDLDDESVPLKLKRNRVVKLKDIECDKAFFIFRRTSCLRKFCYKVYTHRYFEKVILTLIVLSSFKLAADTYFLNIPETHPIVRVSRILDSFFTVTFTLELLIKTITLGFAADNGSYLREGWNVVDFIIVIAGLLDMGLPWMNIESVRVLRLIRTIRPLRFISHNPDLQIVVQALLHSMSAIVNVAIVVFFVWLMFAIFGVSMLGGKFQHCSHLKYDLVTRTACQTAGYHWRNYSSNFDNVINAMQTLFIVSSLQGWPQIMYNAVDSTDIEQGPAHNATPAIAYYFVVFIFIGSFFFVNLFVGVMFLNYKEAKKFDPLFKSTINDRQARWIDIMRLIQESHPDLEPLQRPTQGCRLKLYKCVTHEVFDLFIIICIVLNMIGLALHFEGAPYFLTELLFIANLVFTAIFTIEATLKILGMGQLYFRSKWNVFDFIVVLSSLIEIIIHYMALGSITILRVAPQVIRIFRVLRVTRIIRLINKSKGLQALIFTILFAIRSLFNIFMLLVLIFFIYSVLGVFLFGDVNQGLIISRYTNFNNFGNAMITLLRISTGQEWNRIMQDCMLTGSQCMPGRTCGSSLAPIYFFSFVIVCSYVMLNLFILVIIQQFDDYYLPKQNVLENFKKQLDLFKQQWLLYTKRYNGRRMKQEDLYKFFKEMQEPLGMCQTKPKDIIRNIIKMDIESDPSGLVYFNILLFKAMRRVYGTQGELKPSKLILNYERNTYYRIKRQYYSEMMAFMKNQKDQPQYILTGDKPNLANPMMTRLYLKASFEKWRKMHHNHRLFETGPQQSTTFRIKRKITKDMHGSTQTVLKSKLMQIQED